MNHKVWFGWDLGEWPHRGPRAQEEDSEISAAGPWRSREKVGRGPIRSILVESILWVAGQH